MDIEGLKRLSADRLRSRCTANGIEFKDTDDRETLINKLVTADESRKTAETPETTTGQGAGLPLPGQDEAAHEPEGSSGLPAGNNTLNPTTDRCWFRVAAGQRADEKGPVFAAINGESVLIHRNTWVQLPMKFLPVFKDALTSEVVVLDDAKSVVRDVPRFNFEVRALSDGKPKEQKLPAGF